MRHDDRDLERLARLIEDGLGQRLGRRELIRRGLALGLSLPAIAAALAACGVERPAAGSSRISPWQPTAAPGATPTPAPISGSFGPVSTAAPAPTGAPAAAPTATPGSTVALPVVGGQGVSFAVIGDFGLEGPAEAAVAALVASWEPDFVVSTGDNNYPNGAADTIDRNVGQYYAQFIGGYQGAFGPGADENRFWPVLGNHDWVVGYPEPYLSYFALPGNGRYYSVERGPVALFALDSMPGEPDGITADSAQGAWLKEQLAASRARWKVVVLHHSPFSSGHHGSQDWMRWPFGEWGAQLVLGGHDHTYERVELGGVTYIVNGLGGGARYARGFNGLEGSQLFFNADHGAMLIEADDTRLRSRFVTPARLVIDDFTL